MKLQSMVSFVLDAYKNAPIEDYDQVNETFINKVIAHAEFLQQSLTLSMFIPCGEDGLPMKEPEPSDYFDVHIPIDQYDDSKGLDKYYSALMFWEAAKDRVLFEGFEICTRSESVKCVVNGDFHFSYDYEIQRGSTIESLVKYDLTLTPTAVKQLKK